MEMLRSLLWRRAGREGRAGRFHLGLKTQIAALGLGGGAVIGVIYFIGLRFQGEAQRTADSSARLELLMANVTEGFLEARQLPAEFLQKRDEKLIARHQAVLTRLAEYLDAVEGLIAPLGSGRSAQAGGGVAVGNQHVCDAFQQRGVVPAPDRPEREPGPAGQAARRRPYGGKAPGGIRPAAARGPHADDAAA